MVVRRKTVGMLLGTAALLLALLPWADSAHTMGSGVTSAPELVLANSSVSAVPVGRDDEPCNGPCRRIETREEPCNGPCRRVDSRDQPCNGPCHRSDSRVELYKGPCQRICPRREV